MHDAGAVFGGHELGGTHAADITLRRQIVEQALIAHSRELGAFDDLADGVRRIAEHVGHQILRQDQRLAGAVHEGVIQVRVHGQGQVRRQRPRGGRPHQEGRVRIVRQAKAHGNGRVIHLLVTERYLVGGERGADARIIGYDLVTLVDEVLVPDDFQQIPHRLDVIVVEGVVGVFHVHPETHALGHDFPIADVAHHRFAATAGELGNADLLLDTALVEDSELFLDLVLHRQPVSVPAGLARAVKAAHVLETRKHVLEGARQNMMDAGLAIGRGRTFVPGKQRPALALLETFLEHVLIAPEGEHPLLQGRPVVAAADFLEAHRNISTHRQTAR